MVELFAILGFFIISVDRDSYVEIIGIGPLYNFIGCDGDTGNFFFPVSGQVAHYFNILTTVAIAVLFFLHGAKLSREAVVEGMLHWKMHALVFAFTFLVSSNWVIGKARARAVTRSATLLGLPVHVLLAINSAVVNCIYFYGQRQCGWGSV
ncbi:bile acid:sodium symporter [Acinetobacter vivianii]